MSRRKRSGSEGPKSDGWIATFSDTMTLLLTFFILLYSFSSVDSIKFQQIAESLQNVLTGSNGSTILEQNMEDGTTPIQIDATDAQDSTDNSLESEVDEQDKNIKELYETVSEYVSENNLEALVSIKENKRGVVLEMKDSVLFNSGSADVLSTSIALLDKVDGLIKTLDNEIIVEGHTDNTPIHNSKFDSNWELSTQRAINVVKYFIDVKKNTASRFSAQGYSEYNPIVANDTTTNKAKNRRVNVLIIADDDE
ncbi:MAG: flagellar motor protein MotB [Clostridiaceae bacterium]